MKCLTLLALLILATLAFVQAGKVSIKGECINCNHPTTTTRKPSPARGNGGRTTAKPKPKAQPARKASNSDEDDDLSGGWSLHQSAGGAQHIASRRHKRQWSQRISGWDGYGQDSRSWSGNIDARGRPDTVVRNSDCVGCNIRG